MKTLGISNLEAQLSDDLADETFDTAPLPLTDEEIDELLSEFNDIPEPDDEL